MKKNNKLALLFAGAAFLMSFQSHAQEEFDNFLREDVQESKQLLEAYLSPFMKSVSLGMNQGWYNTAKPHKLFGADLTTSISLMQVPSDERFFDVGKLGLTNFRLAGPTDANPSPDYPNAPTIFGPENTPRFIYTDPEGEEHAFDGPQGIDLKKNIKIDRMPVPIAHLGISLPKGTDLKLRFVPNMKIGSDGEFKFFGVGIMHDVKQYIPGLKLLPFDLSAFAGYTQMDIEYRNSEGTVAGDNQRAELQMSAATVQAVISKKLSVVTFYGGAGYNIAKSKVGVMGTYDLNEDQEISAGETNPIEMKFAASGPRVTAGIRLKLAVFTLHCDYTLQKYSAINAGFGISVR